MSDQKKYNIGDKEVQLAPPTPRRLSSFLKTAGIDDPNTIADKEQHAAIGMKLFQVQIEPDKLKAMMNVCIQDDANVDWYDVDSRAIMEIISDFFSQFS
jgi:hypothetical protein